MWYVSLFQDTVHAVHAVVGQMHSVIHTSPVAIYLVLCAFSILISSSIDRIYSLQSCIYSWMSQLDVTGCHDLEDTCTAFSYVVSLTYIIIIVHISVFT